MTLSTFYEKSFLHFYGLQVTFIDFIHFPTDTHHAGHTDVF